MKTTDWCLAGFDLCLPSSDWAAWAQAIFSAAAVLAAIGVVWWQTHIQRRNDKSAAELSASGQLALVDQTLGALQCIVEQLTENIQKSSFQAKDRDFILTALKTLHLPDRQEIVDIGKGSPDCARRLIRATNATKQLQTAISVLPQISDPEALDVLLVPLRHLAEDAASDLIEVKKSLDKLSPP